MKKLEIRHLLVSAVEGADIKEAISDCIIMCNFFNYPSIVIDIAGKIVIIYQDSTVEGIVKDYDL